MNQIKKNHFNVGNGKKKKKKSTADFKTIIIYIMKNFSGLYVGIIT